MIMQISLFRKTNKKTPFDVGEYRLKIIRNVLSGEITAAQAEKLQRMTDCEVARLIRRG